VSVTISGSEALLKQLQHTSSRLHQAVRKAVEDASKEVVASTQRRVHVDTGNLKTSVDYTMSDGAKIKSEIGWKDRDDRYAVWQEFGTQAMPARPALGPAFNAEKRKIVRRIGDAINAVING
jgi:HK97 gp10 family phage protein